MNTGNIWMAVIFWGVVALVVLVAGRSAWHLLTDTPAKRADAKPERPVWEEPAPLRLKVGPGGLLVTYHAALNIDAMLWAIRARESGDNPLALGAGGERSAYQFTERTWGGYSTWRFWKITANDRATLREVERVARLHLATLRMRLTWRELDAEAPEFVAAAWNFGPDFATAAARTDYAREVAALYWDRMGENPDAKVSASSEQPSARPAPDFRIYPGGEDAR